MSMRTKSIVKIVVLSAVLAIFSPLSVSAQLLNTDDCDKLRIALDDLVDAGVMDDYEKGAVWAKANLPPERIKRVLEFIQMHEKVTFRCPDAAPPLPMRADRNLINGDKKPDRADAPPLPPRRPPFPRQSRIFGFSAAFGSAQAN